MVIFLSSFVSRYCFLHPHGPLLILMPHTWVYSFKASGKSLINLLVARWLGFRSYRNNAEYCTLLCLHLITPNGVFAKAMLLRWKVLKWEPTIRTFTQGFTCVNISRFSLKAAVLSWLCLCIPLNITSFAAFSQLRSGFSIALPFTFYSWYSWRTISHRGILQCGFSPT